MNRNQIIVLVSQKGEAGMKTRRVISMIPLGKGKKVRVVGHSCQVSTLSKGQSGRKKHATGKAACVAHAMFLSDTIMVAVVTTGFGRKKKRRIHILLPGIHRCIRRKGNVPLLIMPLYYVLSLGVVTSSSR